MESSPAAAAMQVASPATASRSRDPRLLVGFDLPASWGYRKPMAFCKDVDASPAAAGAEAQQPNSSRSPTKGAAAAAEDSPRTQCYLLRDRRVGRDSAEDAREHKKLWNMVAGGAAASKWSGGFSLQLSKQEIDADFLAITGRKPPRRHKRRPKSVQRQINALCPGKSLPDVNRDRYKVNEKGGF
uniref:Uncharacterized protein n=1 Tax=Avena sativa TaxID=4498 RepID=A0ACD5T7N8_AVESA